MSVAVKEITTIKDLANKEVLTAVVGAGGGLVAGTYLAQIAKTSLAQTGWAGFGVTSGVKAALALGMGLLAKGQSGLAKILLTLSSIGSLAGIIPDLVAMFYAGGAEAGGQITGLMLRELTLGSEALAGAGVGAGVGTPSPGAVGQTIVGTTDYAGNHTPVTDISKPLGAGSVKDFAGD